MGLMFPFFRTGQVPGRPLTPLMFQLEQAGEGGSSREGRGPGGAGRGLWAGPWSRSSLAWPAGLVKQLLLPRLDASGSAEYAVFLMKLLYWAIGK